MHQWIRLTAGMTASVFQAKVGWEPPQVRINVTHKFRVEFCMSHPLNGFSREVATLPLGQCGSGNWISATEIDNERLRGPLDVTLRQLKREQKARMLRSKVLQSNKLDAVFRAYCCQQPPPKPKEDRSFRTRGWPHRKWTKKDSQEPDGLDAREKVNRYPQLPVASQAETAGRSRTTCSRSAHNLCRYRDGGWSQEA